MTIQDEDTDFKCDACRKPMQKSEECWVIDTHAPIDCTGCGFCLCLACSPGALAHVQATLTPPQPERPPGGPKAWEKAPEGYWVYQPWAAEPESLYKFRAYDMSGCKAHGDLSDWVQNGDAGPIGFDTTCRCWCAVCHTPGRPRQTTGAEHQPGTEAEWHVGELTAFDNVAFYFFVCPSCLPQAGQGLASHQWFESHLRKSVLSEEYNVD